MATSRELDPRLDEAGKALVGVDAVVALSGGADSACLAWLARQYCDAVRAVHVNHSQPASHQLLEAARNIADVVGIDLTVIEVTVSDGPSFEGKAREVRYAALVENLNDGETLLTGHTEDDNAETLIINLIRGAGTTGLSGIPAQWGRVLRPLLEAPRQVVRSLAADEQLPWIEDPTNNDLEHERNRVRHTVMPLLGATEQIARAARLLSLDDQALQARADAVPIRRDAGRVHIPVGPLQVLPPAVSSRVVRRAMRLVNPPYPGSSRMVAAVLDVATGRATAVELGDGVVAYTSQACVVVEKEPPPSPEPALLKASQVRFGPWLFSVRPADALSHPQPLGERSATFADPPELWVRAPAPGDRLAMKGGGHKDLADVFAEADIARPIRRSWPVVADETRVWWVPGIRRAWLGWGDSTSARYLVADSFREDL